LVSLQVGFDVWQDRLPRVEAVVFALSSDFFSAKFENTANRARISPPEGKLPTATANTPDHSHLERDGVIRLERAEQLVALASHDLLPSYGALKKRRQIAPSPTSRLGNSFWMTFSQENAANSSLDPRPVCRGSR
jgi:hypothetical protein